MKADAVIQIGNVVSPQYQPDQRVLFTIGGCNQIEDATIRSFPSEKALLEVWYTFLEQTDPDFIMGHDVVKFDLRYLEDRARLHQIPQAGLPGRQRTATSSFTPMRIRREGLGEISTYMMNISRRVVMDTWVLSWMNHHFPKYTLQDLSKTLLGAICDCCSGKRGITLHLQNRSFTPTMRIKWKEMEILFRDNEGIRTEIIEK